MSEPMLFLIEKAGTGKNCNYLFGDGSWVTPYASLLSLFEKKYDDPKKVLRDTLDYVGKTIYEQGNDIFEADAALKDDDGNTIGHFKAFFISDRAARILRINSFSTREYAMDRLNELITSNESDPNADRPTDELHISCE